VTARPAKITIVTPSLNQAKYLRATLESVWSQEGPFELEHRVVDGGSTDGSLELLRHFAELVATRRLSVRCRGLEFHWVSEADRGQTHAINKGLAQASGDVCAYLNSDDCYLPGALARVVEEFSRHPRADFVHGDGDVVGEHGETLWQWLSRPYSYRVLRSYHWLWNDFTNYILQQATFWRRRTSDALGLFDETLHYSMDLEYWLRAGARGLQFVHVPVKLAQFRMVAGTKSLSAPTAFWLDNMELFRRHNPRALPRLFAFFHYNHERHGGQSVDAEAELFGRWAGAGLSERERAKLRAQSVRGALLARLLLASDRLASGDQAAAWGLVREGLTGRATLVAEPLAWAPLARLALGGSRGQRLTGWMSAAARLYRRRRYGYRYAERRAE